MIRSWTCLKIKIIEYYKNQWSEIRCLPVSLNLPAGLVSSQPSATGSAKEKEVNTRIWWFDESDWLSNWFRSDIRHMEFAHVDRQHPGLVDSRLLRGYQLGYVVHHPRCHHRSHGLRQFPVSGARSSDSGLCPSRSSRTTAAGIFTNFF